MIKVLRSTALMITILAVATPAFASTASTTASPRQNGLIDPATGYTYASSGTQTTAHTALKKKVLHKTIKKVAKKKKVATGTTASTTSARVLR